MKVLITGGAGFIGSNFCHYFYNESDSFVVLDALTYAGNLDYIQDLLNKPNFKFVHGNICDVEIVDRLFEAEKFDVVINFAAESNVDTSVVNPQIFIDSNITGVRVLLDACKKHNVGKFHQVSTDEVYGELLDGESYFYEDTPLRPNNPYSITKATADMLVMTYYKIFGLHTTISRCCNNYGIYQHGEKYIPKIIFSVLSDRNIPVHGDGQNIRDWIHVLDHCQGIAKIVQNGKAGNIYNIGSNNQQTNLAIANMMLDNIKNHKSRVEFVQDRPTNDKRYAINFDKITKELGYKPQYTFDNSLQDIITWYTKNKKD